MNNQLNLKDIVKDTTCSLISVSKSYATYIVHYKDKYYQFDIPLDDIGNSSLRNTEKSISLMRWIRKAIEDNTFIQMGDRYDKRGVQQQI